MHFVIDTVSEFTYFQNILLGLGDALHKCVGVKCTYLKKLIPLAYSDISVWEHKQGVMLPEDLRSFYSSSNGYMFEWQYAFDENCPEEKIIGKIQINPLEELTQVFGFDTTNNPGVNTDGERYILKLAPESKIFELVLIPERGKVVLVYLYPKYVPTIWLLTATLNFYYLADDIATYLRMAIAHLGIPNWQLAYTPQGVPQWTENMFRMLIPHLLPLNKLLENMIQQKRQRKDEDYPEVQLNKFDANLFKTLPCSNASVQPQMPSPAPDLDKIQVHKKQQSEQTRSKPKFQRKPLYYIKKR